MTIDVGDRLPSVDLFVMTDNGPAATRSDEIFNDRRVALFGLPGAFTRTCSAKHLPGYVDNADALKGKGIDAIVCLSVNDAYVMEVWGKAQDVGDKVMMVGDGSLNFTRATGLEADMSGKGFGIRCTRFSMVVDDGVVQILHIDPSGTYEKTSAETMLSEL